jgi:NAD+-dependent protein deacetylase sirtuin 4
VLTDGVARLAELLRGRRVVALTGAGCSTESGIPDYRGGGRPPRRAPVQYREFVGSEATRRRYWARAVLGWEAIASARPNPAHDALAALERAGVLAGVITQNVDGLHTAAGSGRVVELHGGLARVRCMGCGARADRAELQDRLLAANPGWRDRVAARGPDGDADLPDDAVAGFRVEPCRRCGGALKPDVVLFGETVPPPVATAAWRLFDEAERLLVIGSSLAVFSGFRFVIRATERGVPVAIVNRGPTRGDDRAAVRLDGAAGTVLPALATALGNRWTTTGRIV